MAKSNQRAINRFLLLILGFCLSMNADAQPSLSSFKDYYSLSKTSEIDSALELSEVDALLISQLAKESWSVYDLISVDSLLASIEPWDSLRWATCAYVAALAYNDFDQLILDSLSRRSFQVFRSINDTEGLIFAGTLLTESAVQFEGEHTSDFIQSVFDVVTSDAVKSQYPPAILYQIKCYLESERIRGRSIRETALDSILNIASQYKGKSPEAYAIVLSGISVHLVLLQKYGRSIEVSREVLNLALNYSFEDYTCYFNIGAIHFLQGNLDSALIYFHSSRGLLNQDSSERVYKLFNSVQVNLGISRVYQAKGRADSALKYLQVANQNEHLYFNNVLDQRRIYGDIKFEAKAALLEAESLAEEVAREKKRKKLYTLLVILLTITVTTLTAFLFSLRYWVRRYRKLAQNREKILRIINHDLSGSLTMILEYAKIRILKNKPLKSEDEKLKLLNEDFESSIVATEQALANLMIWGMSSPHRGKDNEGLLDLKETVEEICHTLNPLLAPKHLELDISKVESEVLRTDVHAFQLILRNLILNAIKHSTKDSVITISGTADEDKRYITIQNRASKDDIATLLSISEFLRTNRGSNSSILSEGLGYEMISGHLHLIKGDLHFREIEQGVIQTVLVARSVFEE